MSRVKGLGSDLRSLALKSQYVPMTNEEVWNFLERQKVMFVATIKENGKPHNTPVWYVVHNSKLYFRAQAYKMKIRNLMRNPRASCSVHDGSRYTELRGVSIEAEAREIRDRELMKVISRKLMEKYSRERNYNEMPSFWRERWEPEKRVVVEITPVKISSWDNRKWLDTKTS